MTTLVSIVRVEFVLFRTKLYVVIFDLFSYVIWIFIYIAVHSHNLFLFNAQQSSMYYCYTLHTHTQTYTHIHRYTHTNSHTHTHIWIGLVWAVRYHKWDAIHVCVQVFFGHIFTFLIQTPERKYTKWEGKYMFISLMYCPNHFQRFCDILQISHLPCVRTGSSQGSTSLQCGHSLSWWCRHRRRSQTLNLCLCGVCN